MEMNESLIDQMIIDQVIDYTRGIVKSLNSSRNRIEDKTMSQKDRKSMAAMISEIIETINGTEILLNNKKAVQVSEHLANVQDAFISMDAEEIFKNVDSVAGLLPDLEYEINFNQLSAGIFQTDSQIMQLQDEKADLIQQLIDLDMKKEGKLTDLTRQILEVNHVILNESESSELVDDEEYGISDEKLPVLGRVSFSNGEIIEYTDKEEYLKCIREEIDYMYSSGFSYETYSNDPELRKAIDDIVYNFSGEINPNDINYYNEKYASKDEQDKSSINERTVHEPEMYMGSVYFSDFQSHKETFVGKSPEDVINIIKNLQEDKDNPISRVKTVYIQKKTPGVEKTGPASKYDIASGRDITPIYLQIPHLKPEEFKKTTTYLKEHGAVYNPYKKAWYVTKEKDLSKFNNYLPEDMKTITEEQRVEMENDMKENKEQINKVEEQENSEKNMPDGKTVLYGVKVSVYEGQKEITQAVFDKIMMSRGAKIDSSEMDVLDFSNCWFQEVDFDGSAIGTMKNFDFNKARFSDCKFTQMRFENVNFKSATLQSCDIENSEFFNCNFSEGYISQTRDKKSFLGNCSFENVSFRRSSFNLSVMDKPNFNNATMDGTEFRNPVIRGAAMDNMKFTMGGATREECNAYENRTREALVWYDKINSAENLQDNEKKQEKIEKNKTIQEQKNSHSITAKLQNFKQKVVGHNENSNMKEHEFTNREDVR